jgi:phosphatidylinositol alpha-1,6-mannosyltransferase
MSGPRRSRTRIEELVHVSANLRADGGGAAVFGRALGRALRRFASRRGLAFRGLHLPSSDGHAALDGYDVSSGSKPRLALGVAALQLAGAGRRAFVFDHPGPARVQGLLPAPARARYAVAALGIDVWRPLGAVRARALREADAVVAISSATAGRARPFLPAGCRVTVVHPGIEASESVGAADPAVLEAVGRGFVLIVSRLPAHERYKGHDELLAAWPAVLERVPGARLVVAGDGDDRARLEAKAGGLGLAGAVRFVGGVDAATLAGLHRRSALFAMPSRDEGFGLVFLEAMAASRPCLALAHTAPAEIVVDGETGLLVPQGDRAALAAALAGLLADPERARLLGEAGRARFEREFTFEAFERRLWPVLDRLVGGEGA